MKGPNEAGMTDTIHCAIASTMPVPSRMPMRTAAARTIETTETTDPAWALSSAACSSTERKFTTRAIAQPIMNSTAIGSTSRISRPSIASVRVALNQ